MEDGAADTVEAAELQRDRSARTFRRAIMGVLAAGVIALAVMAGVAAWLVNRAQGYSRWTDHTYLVQNDINHLAAMIEQTETARRGYLLVPNPQYRKTYEDIGGQVGRQLDRIAIDTFDDAIQRRNTMALRALVKQRDERVSEVMRLAASGHMDEAVAVFKLDRDHPMLRPIRSTIEAMLAEEHRLLVLRLERERENANDLLSVVLAGGGLLALLTIGALVLMRRYAADLGRAQHALRILNTELEARVKARTAELSRANEEIQRFAYIVSHDLRSPLVNVMGFTSELEVALKALRGLVDGIKARAPEQLPKEVVEAVEVEMPEAIGFIRSSTRKMDSLINAILRLSREGRRTLTPEPLAMNEVVSGLIDSVRHRLGERGAEASIEGQLPDIRSDRLAIEQVFGNLIDNAVKYLSPNRPGLIVVRGRREGGLLIYEIEDNGRGVAPKDHERIFELFRRSGTQDQTGEGIGLAHVRALMYRLGGTISCDSELDRGATFRVSLPPDLSNDRP
jgi:signal transduction histidine kinase